MSNLARMYTTLPPIPSAGVLERYAEEIGVLVPVARTNLVTNPSVETATTNYTASGGSIARSATQQYHGTYSLAITPTAATTDGAYYGTISLTAGVTYAVSCKALGAAGVPYKLSVATTGGVDLVSRAFIGTGFWQWIWLFWTETSSTTRRIYLTKNTSTSTSVFYLDGLQVEACGSEGVFVTTYIDGSQPGYVPNQSPPAYLWTGTPHASTSSRSGQTRAGGRIVKFRDLGFLLTAILGLGLAAPRNEALGFAQLDGAQYRNTIKPQRSLSLIGRWQGSDPTAMDTGVAQAGRLLDRDRIATRQELTLCLQARDCGQDIGQPVLVPRVVYASGLDGNTQELPISSANLTFTQYLPFVVGRDGGVVLDGRDQTSVASVVQRAPNGTWNPMSVGGTAGFTYALARAGNGLLYVGGSSINIGGIANADRIASWDGSAWAAMGAASLNNTVRTLAINPAGLLYVGGQFTNADGNANADYIASWDGSAWAALGTGGNDVVYASAISPTGTLYVGGDFTTMNGVAHQFFAVWDGAAWSDLGSSTAFNGPVYAIAVGPDGAVYAAGNFTDAGGVVNADYIAKWNGSAWEALGTSTNAIVYAVAVGPDGTVYAGGAFTTAGGGSIPYLAQWNGVQWTAVGGSFNNVVSSLYATPIGQLYAAGQFTTVGGMSLPDQTAIWNGSAWIAPDISGLGNATAVLADPDGTITIGFGGSTTATHAGLATATNNGTAATYPTLTITGPSTGTARIYSLVNVTTNTGIYLNYTINAGEVATLVLDPSNLSFTSTFQGNIFRTILAGSQSSTFVLQPGDNTISFFTTSATVTATLSWPTRYLSLDDALYGASDR